MIYRSYESIVLYLLGLLDIGIYHLHLAVKQGYRSMNETLVSEREFSSQILRIEKSQFDPSCTVCHKETQRFLPARDINRRICRDSSPERQIITRARINPVVHIKRCDSSDIGPVVITPRNKCDQIIDRIDIQFSKFLFGSRTDTVEIGYGIRQMYC